MVGWKSASREDEDPHVFVSTVAAASATPYANKRLGVEKVTNEEAQESARDR